MTAERRNDLLVRLLDALERYYQHVSADDDAGRRAFDEASAWFARSEPDDPHGFERICEALGFDAAQIRRVLARRRAEILGARGGPPGR